MALSIGCNIVLEKNKILKEDDDFAAEMSNTHTVLAQLCYNYMRWLSWLCGEGVRLFWKK